MGGGRRTPYLETVYIPNDLGGQQDLAYPQTIYEPNKLETREGFPAWRFGNTDLPVPEFEAMFRVCPRGPDRWDATYVERGWLVRVHGKPRKRYFHPVHRSCPYSVTAFHGNRISVRFLEENYRRVSDDYWHAGGGSCTTSDNATWRGYSIFKLLDKTPADANLSSNLNPQSAGVSSDEGFEFVRP